MEAVNKKEEHSKSRAKIRHGSVCQTEESAKRGLFGISGSGLFERCGKAARGAAELDIIRDRSGTMFMYVLIILIFLFTFSVLVGEFYRIHSIRTNVEYQVQRAVNIAVEEAKIDSFRQDKLGRLDTARAQQNFINYLHHSKDLNPALQKFVDGTLVYTIQLDSITATENPPRLQAIGKIIIPSAYPFLVTNVEVPFSIASRNVRID